MPIMPKAGFLSCSKGFPSQLHIAAAVRNSPPLSSVLHQPCLDLQACVANDPEFATQATRVAFTSAVPHILRVA